MSHIFNLQKEKSYITGKFGFKATKHLINQDKDGRYYTHVNMRDYWNIDTIGRSSAERLGYPTQKPITLLDRIIKASCPPDGVVFDPFCGCGTTIYASLLNQRSWIGCDIAMLSISIISKMLQTNPYNLQINKDFRVDGVPVSLEQAQVLFDKDPFHFQKWAVELVGGLPSSKKTRDGGVDGYIYWTHPDGSYSSMILQVKGHKRDTKNTTISPTIVRDLIGTQNDMNCEMACLIVMDKNSIGDSSTIWDLVARQGQYENPSTKEKFDKIQIISIEEIFNEKGFIKVPTKVKISIKTGQNLLNL